jgi:anti-sigma-K factor RskA
MSRLAQENAEFEELKQFLRGNDTQQVTLHTSVSPSYAPSGHATYKPITGQMVFTAANMPQLQPGKAYELWLLPASGAAPVPAGTFTPDLAGNGAILFPKLTANVPAKGFAITVEDAKGSETPTPPLILSGQ